MPDAPRSSARLPDKSASLWFDRYDGPSPRFAGRGLPAEVECVVVGAGIAGLATAAMLAERGVDVAVVDAGVIAGGATGRSSAKVSVLHDLSAQSIASLRGRKVAEAYVAANRHGFDWILQRRTERSVDCAWEPKAASTYVIDPSNAGPLDREVALLERCGLEAELHGPGLPFATAGAVRLAGQAQFDPVPFLHDMATEVAERGGHLVEQARVRGVTDGRSRVRVHTDQGTVTARWAVVATGLPLLDRGLFFARAEPESSYVVACQVDELPPAGMYLAHDGPKRSLRTAPGPDGEDLLLVGGESHKTGQGGDTRERYQRLVDWADTHFGVRAVTHRFMTEDFMTPDKVPFAGPLHPGPTRVLVATGFNKWGFTNGVAAAAINAAHVLGDEAPWWASAMSTSRLPVSGWRELVKANGDVAVNLAGGWAGTVVPHRKQPAPGEGRVMARGLDRVAVSVDEEGKPCAVSGVCPHLGGILTWNPAESTWDCPLHGSRFERDGTLLHGPAVDDLAPKSSPVQVST